LGMLAPLGWGYAFTALALGVWWQVSTIRLMFAPGTEGAQTVFTRSLYYLALVFAAMVGFSFV